MTPSFLLGPWLVDPSQNTVFRDGKAFRVTPKMMRVLVCLVENAGKTVSKEELLCAAWPDTFVSDDVLKGSISELRRLFEDDAHESHVIQTIPKCGYRLVAPLGPVNGNSTGLKESDRQLEPVENFTSRPLAAVATSTVGRRTIASLVDTVTEYRRAKHMWMLAAAILAVLSVALAMLAVANLNGFGRRSFSMAAGSPVHSVAVLPLQNLSADPAQEYFSDGVTDALITDLAQIGSIRVISRTSTIRYKKSSKSLPEIARELKVDGIVEGTIQRDGNRVRITAQLIEANSDRHLWANAYERDLQDTFSLQSEIARSIAQQIRVNLTPAEEQVLSRPTPVNLRAINPYLLGRYHSQNARTLIANDGLSGSREAEADKAIAEFQHAIAEDPNYAPAYVALARTIIEKGPVSSAQSQQVRDAIRKALAIDSGLAEAYLVLGRLNLFDWQWDAAGHEYLRAIRLNPNLADAHGYYGEYLDITGRPEEGFREAEIAKRLDPSSDRLAWEYYVRRQFDRFIELKRNDVDSHMFGPMAHYDLGYGYELAGKYPEAIQEWELAMQGFGFADLAADMHRGYEAGGFTSAIRAWVADREKAASKLRTVYPEELAYLYCILGEKDRAFAWLEKAYQQKTHGMPFLKEDPTWDNIRSDPRFSDLERRIGLP